MSCIKCKTRRAVTIRQKTAEKLCKECFYEEFENDIHKALIQVFKPGMKVGVGMSGGKDSTVLTYVLDLLNKKYNYGVEIILLCVDEGIKGYRDYSIDTVYYNAEKLNLPLKIVSYKEIFGLDMDEVVEKVGTKTNCTYCGVFRRQTLEIAANNMGVDIIATGHNADDIAETVLLNFIRGDISRLKRCCSVITKETKSLSLSRFKPFKYIYQKDIVLYAFYKNLKYFSTECSYFKNAESRGGARNLIKSLEKVNSQIIQNIIERCEKLTNFNNDEGESKVYMCDNCGNPTSSDDKKCYACKMVLSLEKIERN